VSAAYELHRWGRAKEEVTFMQVTARRLSMRRQAGQGMTEYIIIVALIAIAAITVFAFFGDVVRNQVAGMASELSGKSATENITAAGTASQAARTDASEKEGANLAEYDNSISD